MQWDEVKRQGTLDKRGLDFADIVHFDFNTSHTEIDKRADYGETRFISTGYLRERLCVVCWTVRAGELRIISLRKANDRETRTYLAR